MSIPRRNSSKSRRSVTSSTAAYGHRSVRTIDCSSAWPFQARRQCLGSSTPLVPLLPQRFATLYSTLSVWAAVLDVILARLFELRVSLPSPPPPHAHYHVIHSGYPDCPAPNLPVAYSSRVDMCVAAIWDSNQFSTHPRTPEEHVVVVVAVQHVLLLPVAAGCGSLSICTGCCCCCQQCIGPRVQRPAVGEVTLRTQTAAGMCAEHT